MKIAKVKLIQNGLKGMEVEFQDFTEKDGLTFHDEHKVKFTSPIHKELRQAMGKLKYFLLDVYQHRELLKNYMDKGTFSFITDEKGKGDYFKAKEIWDSFILKGITSNAVDKFILSGEMIPFGNTKCAVNTPSITEESGYAYFDDVIEIINTVYEETQKYVKQGAMADNKQLILDFYESKGEIEKIKEVEQLTPEQMVAQAQQILENYGGIVLMPEDMGAEKEEEDVEEEADEDDWETPNLKIAQ